TTTGATVVTGQDDPPPPPADTGDRLPVEQADVHHHPEPGEHGAHPSDVQYGLIALALAALTAIEVGVYYLRSDSLTIVVLLILMAIKFAVVVGFFMHLRFDSKVLRRLFVGGLVLAVSVYTILLFMLGIFHV
ncbi:MAG TPA: cytochrome C oxidase subunit IV family protein, partial [Acidimicrobiales bacterium]